MTAVLNRVRVPIFFVIAALFAIVSPSKSMQMVESILNGR
jgi:hypothetical protein